MTNRIYEAIDRLKYAYFFKGKSGVYEELKDYTFMSESDLYAVRNVNRNKGLGWYGKMKFVLRKVFVNGLFMRKASVLKQNKYREK
jgi:hypothetical protein